MAVMSREQSQARQGDKDWRECVSEAEKLKVLDTIEALRNEIWAGVACHVQLDFDAEGKAIGATVRARCQKNIGTMVSFLTEADFRESQRRELKARIERDQAELAELEAQGV